MKILEEGPSEFYHEFTCSGCQTTYAAEAEDVRASFVSASYSDKQPEKKYYVKCPRCSTDRKIDSDKIPLLVRQKANDKAQRDWQ